VLMTAPCYDSGEQPDGQPWPEDSADRLNAYNRLVEKVAAANPKKASSFDLDAIACPLGQYKEFMGGVQLRESDGVHFTWLGHLPWPEDLAGSHRRRAPADARTSHAAWGSHRSVTTARGG